MKPLFFNDSIYFRVSFTALEIKKTTIIAYSAVLIPKTITPNKIILVSMRKRKLDTGSLRCLCKTSANISDPPVDPPDITTSPTPIPKMTPPKIAETIKSVCKYCSLLVKSKKTDNIIVE